MSDRGNFDVNSKVPQYDDLPYSREKVTKAEILSLIREALGFTQGQAVNMVYDNKVTPVVVVNDILSYKSWNLIQTIDITALMGVKNFTCFIDNDGVVYGNDNGWTVSFEAYLDGSYSDLGNYMFDLVYNQSFNRCGKYTVDVNVSGMQFFRVRKGGKTLWYFTVPDILNETIGSISISPNGKYLSCSTYNAVTKDLIYIFKGVY